MAIGYDEANDTILILGGYFDNYQLVTFHDGKFYDHGINYFSTPIQGDTEFYSQMGDILWMMTKDGTGFITMNTTTREINIPAITPPRTSNIDCLTTFDNQNHQYVIRMGGKTVYIYNLSAELWLGNVPNMQTSRNRFSCIVHQNRLYAIGGWTYTAESLYVGNDLMDIEYENWKYTNGVLLVSAHTMSIKYGNDVIIFGGYDNSYFLHTQINAIDTTTNSIRIVGNLAYGSRSIGAIIVNKVVYGFGGLGGSSKYQYILLPDTTAPTFSPTTSPSTPPSVSPTTSPSTPPTFAPSIHPSIAPSTSPSTPPTDAPSFNPSIAPSMAPSIAPTTPPSIAPSVAPSIAPTRTPSFSPTRFPTGRDQYEYYFDIRYKMEHLIDDDITKLTQDALGVVPFMQTIIERGYIADDNVFVRFFQFSVQISYVNEHDVEIIDTNTQLPRKWTLSSKTICTLGSCENLQQINTDIDGQFVTSITNGLRGYFNNNNLIFYIEPDSMSSIKEFNPDTTGTDYVFLSILTITLFIVMIGICAFLWNKDKCYGCPGFNPVDESNWIAVIIIGLQFYDFASDCMLVLELWNRSDVFHNIRILISAIGSTIFLVLPYVANLILAINVKKMNIVQHNQAATEWLTAYSSIYTVLVVLTGGAYPALNVVSSNVFGLKYSSSGLTSYELAGLAKIKLFGTVVLENIPQLLCQGLYAATIGGITDALALAFIASMLSITVSTISYFIDRTDSASKTEQYYLVTKCVGRSSVGTKEVSPLTPISGTPTGKTSTRIQFESLASMKGGILTQDEEKNILKNKGKTQALKQNMAKVFGINDYNLQIGNVVTTKSGFITRIVHTISTHDLETMEIELIQQSQNSKAVVTAKTFINELYDETEQDIDAIFQLHYDLTGDFKTSLQWRIGLKQRTMLNGHETENDLDIINPLYERKRLLTRIVSRENAFGIANYIPTQNPKSSPKNENIEMVEMNETLEYHKSTLL